jgi:hypothetical protein
MFEPHVELEDLLWRTAEQTLYELEPALHFWHGLDYVGTARGERPVSFSLIDMAVSSVNNLAYGDHAIHHMRHSLWTEIHARYLQQPPIEIHVIRQLDNEMVEPELMALSMKGAL